MKKGRADYPFSLHDSEELGPAILAISKRRAFNPKTCDGPGNCLKIYTASQGLKIVTPRPSKSFTLRVTIVKPCSSAVAAI